MNELTFFRDSQNRRELQAARLSALVPTPWRPWVYDRGSLTRRLQRLSRQQFHVELLSYKWRRPWLEEARLLGIEPNRRCLVREVLLLGHNRPWVYARSIIPPNSLRGKGKQLLHLGNRPLGALLFRRSQAQRQTIQALCLKPTGQAMLWGRRSRFMFQSQPLLVSEFFLPDLLNY